MSNVRIQVEIPESRVRELDRLMEESGISTRKELVKTALALFEWIVAERQKGRIIASVDEGNQKYKELVMPNLRVPLNAR